MIVFESELPEEEVARFIADQIDQWLLVDWVSRGRPPYAVEPSPVYLENEMWKIGTSNNYTVFKVMGEFRYCDRYSKYSKSARLAHIRDALARDDRFTLT